MIHRERIRTYLEKGYWNRRSRLLSRAGIRLSPGLSPDLTGRSVQGNNIPSRNLNSIQNAPSELDGLVRFVQEFKHAALIGCAVFGSFADGSTTRYSDLDGIILIDLKRIDRKKNSLRSLRNIISKTESQLLAIDALQHHGWHIVFTDDVDGNPHVIPTATLGICFSLTTPFELPLYNNTLDRSAVLMYCQRLNYAIERVNEACSLYSFKSILSRFMLLPALYLQATTGKQITKKESFETLRALMPGLNYSAMDMASAWRLNWSQPKPDDAGLKPRRTHIFPKTPQQPRCDYAIRMPEIRLWKQDATAFIDSLIATLESGYQE
ncbi:MAG: hypothetical protein ACKOQY_11310 [Bacteroidota bacterium]